MPKLRIAFIASLAILGALLVFVVFRPMVTGDKFTEVTRESIIQRGDEWIIQFDLINKEGKDMTYIINWSSGEESWSQEVPVIDGQTFTHIFHVYPETVKEGKVNLTIYREGEPNPFEEHTYYISFDGL